MFAKQTIQSIRKATCSIAVSLRVLVLVFAMVLSPLGFSFSTCHCSAHECGELENGVSADSSPCCCCSTDCGSSESDTEGRSCECDPCNCDFGIAINPILIPKIVDAAKPISISAPDFLEPITTHQPSLRQVDRHRVSLTSNLHAVYCCWQI